MLTLADRLRLLAFDLLLWGWPAREVGALYEAAERLDGMPGAGYVCSHPDT